MAIREYKCPCGVITERLIPLSKAIELSVLCPKCGDTAIFLPIPTGISLARSSFSEAPIDVMVGKDAERRWNSIHAGQESRDKIRKSTGSVGLTMAGDGSYTPVSPANLTKRTELNEVLTTSGHKPTYDDTSDTKILERK